MADNSWMASAKPYDPLKKVSINSVTKSDSTLAKDSSLILQDNILHQLGIRNVYSAVIVPTLTHRIRTSKFVLINTLKMRGCVLFILYMVVASVKFSH